MSDHGEDHVRMHTGDRGAVGEWTADPQAARGFCRANDARDGENGDMAFSSRDSEDVLESLEAAATGSSHGVEPCGAENSSPMKVLTLSLAFGLWWAAYFLVRIRSAAWLSPLELGSLIPHRLFLGLGTGAFAVSFLLTMLIRSLAPSRIAPRLLVGAGAIGGSIVAAKIALGDRPSGALLTIAVLFAWEFVSAVTLGAWVGRVTRLRIRTACIVVCGALMFGGIVSGLIGTLAVTGSVLSALAVGALQPVSVALLVRGGADAFAAVPESRVSRLHFHLPLPILAGVGAYGSAIGFMVTFGSQGTTQQYALPVAGSVAIALMALVILVSVLVQRRVHVRAAFATVLVSLIISYMMLPITGAQLAQPAAMAAYTGLEAAWMTTVAILVRCGGAPVLQATCWTAAVAYASALVGGLVCSALNRFVTFTNSTLSILALGVTVLLIPVTIYLLGENSLTTLWGLLQKSAAERHMDPAELVSARCCALAEQSGLTERESEILKLLALGSSPDEISRDLYISSHTVRTHVKRIHEKLGVHSQPQLISLVVFGTPLVAQRDVAREIS